MANLLAGLITSAQALTAYDSALQTIQNNITNAQTPGFASQTQTLEAGPFNMSDGLIGGVSAGQVISSRDEFAEQNVHDQNSQLGSATQSVNSLTELQNLFPISDTSGIPSALNNLYNSFSNWSESPNDSNARQNVLQNAVTVAAQFQSTAQGLGQFTQSTNGQIQQTVNDINNLSAQLVADNKQIGLGNQNDAGLDANIHNTLDQLSQYINITTQKQNDGTYMVLADGQTPLVIGQQQYQIGFQMAQPTNPAPTNPNGPPHAVILGPDGSDITAQVTGGQLGALVNLRNNVLPQYIGDAYQNGSINTLAQQFADRVNNLLTSGNISDGPPAQAGVPLYTYDTTNPTNVAATLAVSPTITQDQLAAIQPGPPEVSNGTALALSAFSNPQDPASMIGGQSYTGYYANIAASVGTALNQATDTQTAQQGALTQAQNLRQQESGVNLDEQAVQIVQYQQAYSANSRYVSVIETITSDIIQMVNPTT